MSLAEFDAYLLAKARLEVVGVKVDENAVIEAAEHLLSSDFSSSQEKSQYRDEVTALHSGRQDCSTQLNSYLAYSLDRMREIAERMRVTKNKHLTNLHYIQMARKGQVSQFVLAACVYSRDGISDFRAALVTPDKLLSWNTQQLELLLEEIKAEKKLPIENKDGGATPEAPSA